MIALFIDYKVTGYDEINKLCMVEAIGYQTERLNIGGFSISGGTENLSFRPVKEWEPILIWQPICVRQIIIAVFYYINKVYKAGIKNLFVWLTEILQHLQYYIDQPLITSAAKSIIYGIYETVVDSIWQWFHWTLSLQLCFSEIKYRLAALGFYNHRVFALTTDNADDGITWKPGLFYFCLADNGKVYEKGNINSIKEQEIQRQPVTNSLLALKGQVTGLLYEQKILLPCPFNTINPGDIKSIGVLKDADATAIYGSRRTNSAIIINTKIERYGHIVLLVQYANAI